MYKLHKVSFDLYSISTFRYRLKEYRYDLFFNLAPGFLKRKRVRRDKVSRSRGEKKKFLASSTTVRSIGISTLHGR